ncbi:hypothetical protein [uncultured Nitratireductor sp.]|uniref:hypothetical protein n=1 Tax=uncultured Nitratireductor sp. TaxID=520953 RepID=UPI002603AE67|nr:hypothetical protein [uncultured Nitratireductor sp.]
MTEITPRRFDRMTRERAGRSPARIIWTLPAIGAVIGVGPDFVRDVIAKEPGSPIREIGGRYYAFEDDLIAFLRGDHEKPSQTS